MQLTSLQSDLLAAELSTGFSLQGGLILAEPSTGIFVCS